ncbi:DUF7010 family protein [Porphyrobacter sp. AAP82]|uniref:DUF7010 family protein n=1 Tax=Porphyrobacter sp. AAP82 TaxID=1248917 RepID=UPI0003022718|nr:hypothetical protein [Porphyrobacter sp. AAP82]
MALSEAQADLRLAHVNGGAGVIASGLAWTAAAFAFLAAGPEAGFAVLFVCGLAIAPAAQALSKFVFKAPPSGPGKRLEWIAVATVPVLLAGFYFGWRGMAGAPFAAIPMVAIAVGARYLVFPVMYGGAVFPCLGAVFIAGGAAWLAAPESAALPVTIGLALAELALGALLVRQWRGAGEPA